MISSNSTPKPKTSDFMEYRPSIAYSGAIYPLQNRIVKHANIWKGKNVDARN